MTDAYPNELPDYKDCELSVGLAVGVFWLKYALSFGGTTQ